MLPATLPERYGFEIQESENELHFRAAQKKSIRLGSYLLLGILAMTTLVITLLFSFLGGLIMLVALFPAYIYLTRNGPGHTSDFAPLLFDKANRTVSLGRETISLPEDSHFAYFTEKKLRLFVGGLVLNDGEREYTLLEMDSTSANFLKDDLILLVNYCNDWLAEEAT